MVELVLYDAIRHFQILFCKLKLLYRALIQPIHPIILLVEHDRADHGLYQALAHAGLGGVFGYLIYLQIRTIEILEHKRIPCLLHFHPALHQ